MWLRRKIAALLAWVGKVTLLFAFSFAGIGIAVHVLRWLETGEWPAALILGEPLRESLRDMGVEAPSFSWAVVQTFVTWVLDQPTWMIAFLAAVGFGLLLVTWSDAMERSIRFKLRHQLLRRDRLPPGQ